jgi:hypothetical protein
VPLRDRLFVDAEVGRHARALGTLAALDGPLQDVPGFVPADAQDPGGALDVSLLEDVDRQAFKEGGEPGPNLSPRQTDLPDPVGRALHPWRLRVQVGHELAAVKMPPHACLGVVIEPQQGPALGTRPADVLGMARPHVDPLPRNVQLHRPNGPRRLEAQQMAVEFDIAHGTSPPGAIELEPCLHHPATHGKAG